MSLTAQPTLSRYVAKVFLSRFVVLFIGIAVVLLALDMLRRSGDVLAADGASLASLWRYMALRLPQILAELPPFATLLATLISFAALSQHSEVIIMQVAGMSAFRILVPMVAVTVVIAILHFLFNETVVVNANVALDSWRESGYAVSDAAQHPVRSRAWAVEGRDLVQVGAVTRGGTILDKVTLYERNENFDLKAVSTANFAAYVNGKWTMFDVRRFDVGDHSVNQIPVRSWNTALPPERFLALAVKPTEVSFLELWKTTSDLIREGQKTSMLIAWLNQKIAGPASSILMPLLGVLAGFGVLRSGLLFVRVSIGMALGFSFFVVDNLLLAFGKFGTLPPALAAWTSLVLFLLIGLSVVVYAEE